MTDREELAQIIGAVMWKRDGTQDFNFNAQLADTILGSLFIARLIGERGTALQTAQCYRAQRDLAWAEIDRLKAEPVRDDEEPARIAGSVPLSTRAERGARDVSSPEAVERIWAEAREQVRKERRDRMRRAIRVRGKRG